MLRSDEPVLSGRVNPSPLRSFRSHPLRRDRDESEPPSREPRNRPPGPRPPPERSASQKTAATTNAEV
jgi:hypothetical protein